MQRQWQNNGGEILYKCNDCNRFFEQSDTYTETAGEKRSICPFCRSNDFDEIKFRSKDDKQLFIEKTKVADFVVDAICFINKGEAETAKEVLIALVEELVGYDFEFNKLLETIENQSDEVIEQIQTIIEMVKI